MEDLVATESLHGKLTSIVQYWIRYTRNGKREILSFGLGNILAVNSLVRIPTIKAWQCLLDFNKNSLIVRGLNTRSPLIYETTKYGLPPGVVFLVSVFCAHCKNWYKSLLLSSLIWVAELHPQKILLMHWEIIVAPLLHRLRMMVAFVVILMCLTSID